LSLTVTLIVASLPQSNYLPPLREITFLPAEIHRFTELVQGDLPLQV
jgi:hypothetical protein